MRPRTLTLIVQVFVSALPAGAAGAQTLAPCRPPFEENWACGTLPVPENRQTGHGRTIRIEVMVRRASRDAGREPIFVFSGGPGSPTATVARPNMYPGQAATRDLVLIDQRGTGRSNGFTCDPDVGSHPHLAFGQLYPMDAVEACYRRIREGSDPDQYTTADFAADVEAVREWLGYPRIVLSGGSYGTRSAMTYAGLYPERVAAAVLNGVLPPDENAPLSYARTAQEALERVYADCANQPACHRAFPRLGTEFAGLMDRLRSEPVTVSIRLRDGSVESVRMGAADLGYAVRIMLYDRNLIPLLPRTLHHAAVTGDLSVLAQAHFDRAVGVLSFASLGLHLSVFCAEDVPFLDGADLSAAIGDAWFGTYFVDQYREGCRRWPVSRRDRRSHEIPALDIPVLMLSGRYDPVTPPAFAERTRRLFPNSAHVILGTGGHGASGPCVEEALEVFYRTLDPRQVTDACAPVTAAVFVVR